MRQRKIFLIISVIVIISSMGLLSETKSPLTILYPKNGKELVTVNVASITGRFNQAETSEIEILSSYKITKKITAATKKQKENFAYRLQKNFPDNFILKQVILKTFRARGNVKIDKYNFNIKNEVDLKKFWYSKSFKEILASVYDMKTYSAEFTLIGFSKKRLDVKTIDYKKKFRDYFSFTVSLNTGMNLFYLRSINNNDKIIYTDSVKIFYRPQFMDKNPTFASYKSTFHTIENEKQCNLCHLFKASSVKLTEKSDLKAECSSCHSALSRQKSVHAPINEWKCLLCHNPNSSPKYLLYKDKEYNSSLCYGCHTNFKKNIESKSYKHGIVQECLICHDSHASKYDDLVIVPVAQLCVSCHTSLKNVSHPVSGHPVTGPSNPLEPKKKFSCVSCHSPHASNNQYMLIAPESSLCEKCHHF